MKLGAIFSFLIGVFLFSGCASTKTKDISYLGSKQIVKGATPRLNVFSPKKGEGFPVVIFVHGGNWNAGNKNIYHLMGRNFGRKDVVTVIPSYTLSPKGNFDTMAQEIAEAVNWTKNNIKEFGGDPDRIYLMGHSAGGHLVALITTNPKYLEDLSVIKGTILNDAAGLDMITYLQDYPPTSEDNYDKTWTKDPGQWLEASPMYFLDKNTPPFLAYLGTKTYPSIEKQNIVFMKELRKFQPEVKQIILKKTHVPMVTQFFKPWSNRYDEILEFMGKS